MEKVSTIKDPEINKVIDEIVRLAFGNPIIFVATPTNATMKANTWGIYGTDLYVKCANNVTLKLVGINVA